MAQYGSLLRLPQHYGHSSRYLNLSTHRFSHPPAPNARDLFSILLLVVVPADSIMINKQRMPWKVQQPILATQQWPVSTSAVCSTHIQCRLRFLIGKFRTQNLNYKKKRQNEWFIRKKNNIILMTRHGALKIATVRFSRASQREPKHVAPRKYARRQQPLTTTEILFIHFMFLLLRRFFCVFFAFCTPLSCMRHSNRPSHLCLYLLCAKLHFNINFIIAKIPSVIIFHNYELKVIIIYRMHRPAAHTSAHDSYRMHTYKRIAWLRTEEDANTQKCNERWMRAILTKTQQRWCDG